MDSLLLLTSWFGTSCNMYLYFLWKYILIFKNKQCLPTVKKGEKDKERVYSFIKIIEGTLIQDYQMMATSITPRLVVFVLSLVYSRWTHATQICWITGLPSFRKT